MKLYAIIKESHIDEYQSLSVYPQNFSCSVDGEFESDYINYYVVELTQQA